MMMPIILVTAQWFLHFYPSAKAGGVLLWSACLCLYVHTSHFQRYRSQFKSDRHQTWYDEWLWVQDDAYCWTLWSDDHSGSGPLISTENLTFSYIFHTGDRNSSWISTKLGMNDGVWSGTNPIQWRHDDVITDVTVRWLRTKNFHFFVHFPHWRS